MLRQGGRRGSGGSGGGGLARRRLVGQPRVRLRERRAHVARRALGVAELLEGLDLDDAVPRGRRGLEDLLLVGRRVLARALARALDRVGLEAELQRPQHLLLVGARRVDARQE